MPQRFATERANILGVIIPVADRNFFGSIVRGIEEVANNANLSGNDLVRRYEDPDKEAAAVEAAVELKSGWNHRVALQENLTNFDHFNKVILEHIPLVLFDRSNDQLKSVTW